MTAEAAQTESVLTTEQLAARWKLKTGTLGNWRREGKGPKFIRLGDGPRARVVYRVADVERYELEAR